jgi:hypothetical protein
MIPLNLTLLNPKNKHQQNSYKSIESCNYQVGLDENLEYYFTASESIESHADSNTFYLRSANANNNTIASGSSSNRSIKYDRYFTDIDSEYSILFDKSFDFLNASFEQRRNYLREKEQNLLNLKHLKSLCAWDKKMLNLLVQAASKTTKSNKRSTSQVPCYLSLPSIIALMNNKTDCMELTAEDVRNFLGICRQCYALQKTGILYAIAEDSKQKSDIINLLTKNDPLSKFVRSSVISENICFKKNLMHIVYEYLIDKQFMAPSAILPSLNHAHNDKTNDEFSDKSFNVKVAALLIINGERRKQNISSTKNMATVPSSKKSSRDLLYDPEFIFDFYMNDFHRKTFDDKVTSINGLNLMGIRQEAAMRLISQEMSLVALAIILIVIATLLYLKSVVISMMINLSVGLSVGVSFFAYRIVFDIDLFPFLNMMAAFLLLGNCFYYYFYYLLFIKI